MRALLSIVVLLGAATASAAPARLSYQGRLLQADGTPATGVQTLGFSVFAAPTGGAPLWSESQQVLLTDGFYSIVLGDATDGGFPPVFDGSERYLEVSVGGAPLSPRQRVDSVAYALNAGSATNLSGGTVDATSISVNGSQVINSSGQIALSSIGGIPDGGFVSAVKATGPLTSTGGSTPSIGLTACGAGQLLGFDGTSWGCVTPSAGTAYTGSQGIAVSGSSISLGACGIGEVWKSLSPGWSCAPDDNTTYSAGPGLALIGTKFSVNPAAVQSRIAGGCGAGQYVQSIYIDGGVACGTDQNAGGTVTSVTATTPLSVATGSTTPAISMTQASGTADGWLASADWNTFNGKQARVTGTCANGQFITAVGASGSVTCTGATAPTRQVFTNPGTSVYATPPGVRAIQVECIGGGGAGGAAQTGSSSGVVAVGGGGGGGWYAASLIPNPAASYSVTVGAGGVGAGTQTGGASIFGSNLVVAMGGAIGTTDGINQGGDGPPPRLIESPDPSPGSIGQITVGPAYGGNGFALSLSFMYGGRGGAAAGPYGGGGARSVVSGGGDSTGANAPAGYGGGGGGAAQGQFGGGPSYGGNGANGIVVVTEFY